MGIDTANGKERYDELKDEIIMTAERVGWRRGFVEESIPIIPLSVHTDENITEISENMSWWPGQKVTAQDGKPFVVDTLMSALTRFVQPQKVDPTALMRTPISGIYKIKGVGDVLAGTVAQGIVRPGEEVVFLPTHTKSNPCWGRIFSIEMHHKRVDQAGQGCHIGVNIKGLNKGNMPRSGDVMVYKKDTTLRPESSFTAQIQTLDIPGEVKCGYTPIGFSGCASAACRMTAINWKMGRETGNAKAEYPTSLKANERAEVQFEPAQPFFVDSFKSCEVLSQIAFLEGDENTVVMLGKVVSVGAEKQVRIYDAVLISGDYSIIFRISKQSNKSFFIQT